jgi:hypothetical protein
VSKTNRPTATCAPLGFIAGHGSLACEQRHGYLGFEPSAVCRQPSAVCAPSVGGAL